MSVLSVCRHPYLGNHTRPTFIKFYLHDIACSRGSVLLWRRCSTSGFVVDVMFSYSGPFGDVTLQQQQPRCDAVAGG